MKKQNNVGADDPTMYAEFVRRNVGADDPVRPQKRNTQKGITLIALIISIIVMLILAVVSINIIINQGIITKSQTATDTHQVAAEKEAIQIGYSEYLNDKYSGTTPLELKVADANVQENANEWTITFNAEPKNVYKLSKDGGEPDGPLTGDNAGGNEGTLTDEEMQVALQSFTANPQNYVHSEQSSTNKDRAIGTDGKAVNMDLWGYTILNEDNKEVMLSEYHDTGDYSAGIPGYLNNNIVNGKIQGTVPQYIYIEEKREVYTVTSMSSTFIGCSNLVEAPVIPSTVIDMESIFFNCEKLKKAPVIPNGVKNLKHAFMYCTNLTQSPEIPSSVTTMEDTFLNCSSLTQVQAILNGVKDMTWTFYGCTSLTQAPEIPSSVTSLDSTFYGCTSLTQAPTIPSSVTSLYSTFDGCTSLMQAPEIPSSVTDMRYTFYGCDEITGIVRVNAKNINNVDQCFDDVYLKKKIIVQVPLNSTTYNTFNSKYGNSEGDDEEKDYGSGNICYRITIETF